jgi:hypothetical protein
MAAPVQMYPPDAMNTAAQTAAQVTLPQAPKSLLKKYMPELIGTAVVIVIFLIYKMVGKKAKTPLAAGTACKADSDCSGGVCARDPNNPGIKVCCSSADKVRYWFKNFCGDQPTGSKCLDGKMCASGDCGVFDAAHPHIKKCCANGTVNHLFKKYCAGQSAGADCRVDGMCSSGKCSGNLFGLKLGKCK